MPCMSKAVAPGNGELQLEHLYAIKKRNVFRSSYYAKS